MDLCLGPRLERAEAVSAFWDGDNAASAPLGQGPKCINFGVDRHQHGIIHSNWYATRKSQKANGLGVSSFAKSCDFTKFDEDHGDRPELGGALFAGHSMWPRHRQVTSVLCV